MNINEKTAGRGRNTKPFCKCIKNGEKPTSNVGHICE